MNSKFLNFIKENLIHLKKYKKFFLKLIEKKKILI